MQAHISLIVIGMQYAFHADGQISRSKHLLILCNYKNLSADLHIAKDKDC